MITGAGMDTRKRTPWLILAAAGVLAAGIVGGALIVAGRDAEPAAASGPEPTASPEASSWPPPLPPGVPTTGPHAWRATWTPEPSAEREYMDALAGSLDPEYIAAVGERKLIDFGYAICADYFRGVPGAEEYEHIIGELVADPLYHPELADDTPYGDVRSGSAATDAVTIEMAANHQFCMNVDPWGESY